MSSPEPVSGQVAPYAQQPSPGQQTGPGGQRPVSRRRKGEVIPGVSGALIGGAITALLGILLGVANQGAVGTSMNLRVPALLAALLMVGQGVVDIRRSFLTKPVLEVVPAAEPPRLGTELPGSRSARTVRAPVSVMPAPKPTLATMAVPVVVLTLAAWLGWADLVTAAPDSLTVLSLIASFALFALGWSLLPTRH